jgi:transcriptional regulator GlxA family with amidase domain
MSASKTIVFLAAPDTQILDVAGPFQAFVRAAELFVQEHPAQRPPYKVLLASSTRYKSVTTNCELVLSGAVTYRTLRGPIDTLLVAGGTSAESVTRDEALLLWLRKTAQRVRRVGSICTGAFLLASAGLLDGKRAATHWKWAAELKKDLKTQLSIQTRSIYAMETQPTRPERPYSPSTTSRRSTIN